MSLLPFAPTAVAALSVVLADDLSNPAACLPPGFSGPVTTVLGWVKAIGLVVALVSMIRIGVHILRQQGDGVPDRDDTMDKLFNWAVGSLIVSSAVSFLSALGMSVSTSC
ncbi:MAG: hypothetical protein KHX65_04215 [Bifidobacterium sp.]|uniref:hypothetical protein n=1 Tax=Bifidobacterium sp. TaxID=41200 RepID=UPI00257BAAC7|nr:hypothetical protein [Bifidobacterium sp.]MBS5401125.1 hypothetical protein [Bifidobacterium sp.]